jgi:hypothetical protein
LRKSPGGVLGLVGTLDDEVGREHFVDLSVEDGDRLGGLFGRSMKMSVKECIGEMVIKLLSIKINE